MFSSNSPNTATSQDQARLPRVQNTAYPINNAYNDGASIQRTGVEEATPEYNFGLWLAGLKQDHLIDPYFQAVSLSTELHSDFPDFQQPATAGCNSAYMGNPSYQAIPQNAASVSEPYQLHVFESAEVPAYLVSPSVGSNAGGPVSSEAIPQQPLRFDELFGGDRREIALVQQEELKRASDNMHRKRLRTSELDLGAGPSHWVAESEDLHTSAKRRRITMERKTEDRVVAQRGETQELHARRTSARQENVSKLGNQGLRMETPVALSQGVHPPFSPRPTTGATLVPTEGQVWTWTEGSEHIFEGTEDVHDEETDGERWSRLGVLEQDEWRCRECPGKTFFDRSTLRRHCKTVHGRECDRWKCRLCPDKSYSRKSGLDRHMKKGKHQRSA